MSNTVLDILIALRSAPPPSKCLWSDGLPRCRGVLHPIPQDLHALVNYCAELRIRAQQENNRGDYRGFHLADGLQAMIQDAIRVQMNHSDRERIDLCPEFQYMVTSP